MFFLDYRHFTNSAGGYDVGLIKMSRPVSFNSYTYPALIVNRNYRPNLGDTLYAVGWGRTSPFNQDESNQLKAVRCRQKGNSNIGQRTLAL